MPHVDEGTLHALLDGALRAIEPERAAAVEAHLASCAECRALAAEAAEVRGRAGEVLDLLEPGVAPDFQEVLVRAGAAGDASTRGALVRQARWTRRLAWAATVVIALGTGYLIRDRMVPERAASFSTEAPAAPDRRSVEQAPSTPTEAAEAADGPGTERPAEDGPRRDVGGGGAGAAAPTQAQEAAPGVSRAAADAAEAEPQAARPIAVAPAPPPPPPPSAAPARRAADIADAGVREALVPVESAPALGARVEQEPLTVQERMFVSAAASPGSRVITPEEAADVLGAPFLVLPRADVTLVTVQPGEHGEVVVSLQRLADGVVIRVTQAPLREPEPLGRATTGRAMSAAAAAPAPARMKVAAEEGTGAATARVRVADAELVLEGPLPAAALELLGGAAAPYARPR